MGKIPTRSPLVAGHAPRQGRPHQRLEGLGNRSRNRATADSNVQRGAFEVGPWLKNSKGVLDETIIRFLYAVMIHVKKAFQPGILLPIPTFPKYC